MPRARTFFAAAVLALLAGTGVCLAQADDQQAQGEPILPQAEAPAAVPEAVAEAPVPAVAGAPVEPAGAVAQSTVTTYVTYAPVQDRDPMRSMDDARAAQAEIDRAKEDEARRIAAEKARERERRGIPADPLAESRAAEARVKLQGIIGNQAIINDKTYSQGDVLPGGVKIVKITVDTVVFRYKRNTFTKKVKLF